jgi:hypothetical protein
VGHWKRSLVLIDAILERWTKRIPLETCRLCGKKNISSKMSELPLHGFFCNDKEATEFWEKRFQLGGSGNAERD